ncbi:Structural maintenance of chromosomes protein 6 [Podila verticillata]|nr:Structural maintenance of chromosomes protein 6 [Podila verticillata]
MPDITRKRRLIQDEDEDEVEEQDVRSSRSSKDKGKDVKGKSVKRSKQQDESENDMATPQEDEDEDSVEREEPEGEEWQENNNTDDMEWQELAAIELENAIKRPGHIGAVAEMGVIEMIEMFDFMCHRHLKVPFGPKINFVIGHNGSGKSAILTAIMVCLGGKANATNRAQSLKALIREGATQTDVKLQLRNRGLDAYRPEVYGDSIIIERRISRDGGSSYKIKSAKGKTISTKREELAAMCDHMNIQVDNPMNVLSQDTARQFIQSSTAEEKYRFFMRGTQLTQLSQDYELVRECIDTMQTTLKTKREILPELFQLAKSAQARFKDMQAAATLELKMEGLKHQVAWAQIDEMEKGVREAEEDLQTKLRKIPAIETKKANETNTIQEIDTKLQEVEQTMQSQTDSNAPALIKKRELEGRLREKRNMIKEIQEEEKTVNEEIKELREKVRMFDQRIAKEMQKLDANSQEKRAATEEQIRKMEQDMDDAKRRLAELRETKSAFEKELEDQSNKQEKVATAIRQTKNEMADAQERVRQIRDRKENALKAFGPSIPDVLRDIEDVTARNGWRREPPVGPLGRHVKLRQQNWAPVLESALGANLNAFAVQDDGDMRTLRGILQRRRCNSPVFTTKKILFDYREPDSRFLTINRALNFDHEWVRRLLIDKASIEQTILVEQRQQADRITSSGRDGGMPENVSRCLTLDLMQVGDRFGGAASIMMQRYKGPPRLSSNVDQELGALEGTVARCQDSLRFRLSENQGLVAEVEKLHLQDNRLKKEILGLEQFLRKQPNVIEKLRETLQEDRPTNLDAYEESKQQVLEKVETMKKQYEPIAEQKQKVMDEMDPIREEIKAINEALVAQESNVSKIQRELDDLNIERTRILPKIQHWDRKLEEERRNIHEMELDLKEKTKNLQDSTEQASKYCERVEITGSTTQLEREIKQIQNRLREREKERGCSLEEVTSDMNRKQDEYRSAKIAIHQLDELVKYLKKTLNTRMLRWTMFRSSMAARSVHNFNIQLSERGYSGELSFEHKEKKLTIRVETEDNTGKAEVARDKDPKSLSGGERSFSTICLLLALWDSMASSIRCLDEFDVFMDAVNRRISMKMLIGTARQSDGVQYILITPQDASSVSPGPDVRVHRLHDPERNQQTL